MESQIDIFDEEIIIFEIKQNPQIQEQSGEQTDFVSCKESRLFFGSICHFLGNSRNFSEQKAQEKVQSDAAQNDSQITDIKIGVKPQGHGGQKKTCQFIFAKPVKPVPSDQRKRQKYENKDIGIK